MRRRLAFALFAVLAGAVSAPNALALPRGGVELLDAYDKGLIAKAAEFRRKCAAPDRGVPEGFEEVADPANPPCLNPEWDGSDMLLRSARLLSRRPAPGESPSRQVLVARRRLTADLLVVADAVVDRSPPREARPRVDNVGVVIGPPSDRLDREMMAASVAALWLVVREDAADRQAFRRTALRLAYPGVVLAYFRQYPPDRLGANAGAIRADRVDDVLDHVAQAVGFADLAPSPDADAAMDAALKRLEEIDFRTEVFLDPAWAGFVAEAAIRRLKAKGDCGDAGLCLRLVAALPSLRTEAEHQIYG